MSSKVYIEVNGESVEIVCSEDGELTRYYRYQGDAVGNIYRGKVERVTAAGAFLDIGRAKHGFLSRRDLKAGDYVTVQTAREEQGNKGCLLTERLSLAGKYVVAVGGENKFSRKLSEDRRKELSVLGDGVIFRTACEHASDAEIAEEAARLNKERAEMIAAAANLYKVALLRQITPEELAYSLGDEVVFGLDEVRGLIEDLSNRKIERDGVEIVIDKTEAMTVIDVNSHCLKEKYADEESMALAVNLTAAELAARQIRLRNIGGLIAVDFVNMRDEGNIERVKKEFLSKLKEDYVTVHMEFVDRLCVALVTRRHSLI